jgi:glycosyltransferase involved in cell wall biosynthesis
MRGGQWQVLRLHSGLVRRGHESVLAAREDGPLLAAARSAGLPAERLRALGFGKRSRTFDIVHAHDARTHTLGALFARAPLIVSRRVAFPVRTSAASRWKYRKATLYLAVSRFVAGELEKAGVESERIRVVYDGVPLPALTASGGRILAIEKIAPILDGLAEPVRDFDTDLPQACTLIYLSNSEGLGSGILLAMAYGVPVIASKVGGIPEIIHDGVNGLLIANRREAVAEALMRITPAMGQAARLTVEARFSEDKMVDATLAAYEEAC